MKKGTFGYIKKQIPYITKKKETNLKAGENPCDTKCETLNIYEDITQVKKNRKTGKGMNSKAKTENKL